jgi:hypothetical protein
MKFFYVIFESSVPTAQVTYCVYIINTNWVILFRYAIGVYSENYKEYGNIIREKMQRF